jgi:hypothetical protein
MIEGMRRVRPPRLTTDDAMPIHHHTFVEEYEDMVAFGFSREVDEKSLIYYLQKFSDDDLLRRLAPRLAEEEINQVFELISHLMRKHFSDDEYHELFLKDSGHNVGLKKREPVPIAR